MTRPHCRESDKEAPMPFHLDKEVVIVVRQQTAKRTHSAGSSLPHGLRGCNT